MKKFYHNSFCNSGRRMLFLSGIWIYFQKTLDKVDLGEGEGATGYEKHYLMISGEKKYPDVGFHLRKCK